MATDTDSSSSALRTWHVLVIDDDQGRRAVALNAATYSIGRDPNSAIVVHSSAISRQHALLLRLPQKTGQYAYRLLDGNIEGKRSTNGISVNGKKCFSWDLKDGDQILLGDQVPIQYCIRQLSEEDFQQYLQSASFRSVKAEVVDRRSTTMQKFDPPVTQVILPKEETTENIKEAMPRRRNALWLLIQTVWRRLRQDKR
ncbi:FHA domain-containing protein [Thermostichus vulcanus]|uniref:FHA domain-containing protein n=1 Tax=Thermostichus vulcanus str. 'Rupite' TaxID=2813851 RepID=A0ABT0CAB3_THEVL|nr:FHA domain-containing protein [Thermostichus vulcanus]MCJ2542720.1 FHA domain-containing protein [Thermostichus vulcanus str. 'Rupite']